MKHDSFLDRAWWGAGSVLIAILLASLLIGCSDAAAPEICDESQEYVEQVTADSLEIVICNPSDGRLKMCIWKGDFQLFDRDSLVLMCRSAWADWTKEDTKDGAM